MTISETLDAIEQIQVYTNVAEELDACVTLNEDSVKVVNMALTYFYDYVQFLSAYKDGDKI